MIVPFALTDITVLTGDAAGTVHPHWTVAVDATGTISFAGPATEAPLGEGALRIDGRGKYLLPGLINAHAHLFADGTPLPTVYTHPRITTYTTWVMRSPVGRQLQRRRARKHAAIQLSTGVTTIRTVGDVAREVIETRDLIDAGALTGPRLLPAGPLMAITGGHGAPGIARIADDPQTARANARQNLREGAQVLKISATGGVTDAVEVGDAGKPEMSEEAMRAICEEAHDAGVLVAAHAQSSAGTLAALRAGVDTIEHGCALTPELIELFLANPASLRGYSALIPTMQACLPLVLLSPEATGIDEVVSANATMVYEEMVAGLRDALEHGIMIGVGTDSGISYVTHANYWRELDFLASFGGMEPGAVLHAATQVNAKILGIDGVTGAIEAGKVADLVVLEQNPLEDFRHLAQPWMVVARGERLSRPQVERIEEIDAQLDTLRTPR